MKYSTVAIVFSLLLSACATGTVEPPPDAEPATPVETNPFDEVLLDISICSPGSLSDALETLETMEAGSSEYGQELRYVAAGMAGILYPEIARTMPPVPEMSGGMYPDLFARVRAGSFPEVPQAVVSFITLIIPPMACLFTSDPLVLERCNEALLQAESLETRSVVPPYLLGVIREKQESWSEAMEYYADALDADESCYPANTGWARCALRIGRVEEALARLKEESERFGNNASVLYHLSFGHFLAEEYGKALEAITGALWEKPEEPRFLLLRARILEAQGNIEQARRILSIVQKKIPENEEMVYLEASILFKKMQYNEASAVLENAVSRYPSSSALADLYGEVLIASGRSEDARAYLEEKLEENPENPRALELLAGDAREAGELEKAAAYIERLLDIEEEERYLRCAADIYRAMEDWQKTLSVSEELYEREPGNGETILLYLDALIRTGNTDRAGTVARGALEVIGDSGVRSSLYYHLYRVTPEKSEQLDLLRSALLENLHNLDALVALADVHAKAGEYRKAYRYINQAYMLNPEDPVIRAELRRIEELAK